MSATADDAPELRMTHSGMVLLSGRTAYKFKRPVRLAFLDFTQRERRRAACERELTLNRRLAPDVYLGLGSLGLEGGDAEPCLVMRRLPDDRRLAGVLDRAGTVADIRPQLDQVARVVATFHEGARRGDDVDADGTCSAVTARWRANLSEAGVWGAGLDPEVVAEIATLAVEFLTGREPLFRARVDHRRIVDGHGDLLAEDVFCLDDGPRILDCLDFDDHLRHVDVIDDLAFLAMDVERLGPPGAADHLLDRYLELTGDLAPPALVHHYVAYRAFVRAKVGCLSGAAHDRHHGHASTPAEFAALALQHLRRGRVRLVLCGGAPGTGKSTLAGALADRHGWVVLSSDRIRKELAGIDPGTSAAGDFGAGLYDPAWSRRTYDELGRRARTLLQRGESVVLDATWSSSSHRERAASLAAACAAPLVEIRCDLDEAVAASRIEERDRGPSDADTAVAHRLRTAFDAWPSAHVVDTSAPLDRVVSLLDAILAPGVEDGRPVRRTRSLMAPD